MKNIAALPSRFYGENAWKISELSYKPHDAALNATLFALANGVIGLRGDLDESVTHGHGCYLNGIYSSEPILYGESAYGFAKNNQKIASAPSPLNFVLAFDGEQVDCSSAGKVMSHKREFGMDDGSLQRETLWRTGDGSSVKISSKRLVSLKYSSLVAIEYSVESVDFQGELSLQSGLHAVTAPVTDVDDPRAGTDVNVDDMEVLLKGCEGNQLHYVQRICSTGFYISVLANHLVEWNGVSQVSIQPATINAGVTCNYSLSMRPGEKLTLTKYVSYTATRDARDHDLDNLRCELNRLAEFSFAEHSQLQAAALADFWKLADINIDANLPLLQGMRFNLFHLFQSVGRSGKNNIAAKGITGNGYDGHYFWDTEIYIFPFFLFTKPELARNLLMYRYGILDSARQRARELSIPKGALFPWRTIGGEECSAYYPAGTAQYHINADIAYAVQQYHLVTNDADFLKYYGAEIVLEGARVWLSIGHYDNTRNNQFCICSVTGPDEYTAVVNNNFYTNLMAKNHLQFASDVYEWLKVSDPQYTEVLSHRLGLSENEVKQMASAAANMYLPYDETRGIHLQDDAFLNKPDWDFAGVPAEKYPLLLHFHPLVIYRHKVCKQADTVLALLLLNDKFSPQQKKNNFDFYEPITTHDSTLSACIHSIIANEVGYSDKALQYFNEVVRMDLDNRHNNTQHGIHTACMGGAWLCMVQGFAGMRVSDNKLIFCPTYEKEIGSYTFQVKFRGRELQVRVTNAFAEYTLLSGDPMVIKHFGEDILVREEKIHVGLGLHTRVLGEAS